MAFIFFVSKAYLVMGLLSQVYGSLCFIAQHPSFHLCSFAFILFAFNAQLLLHLFLSLSLSLRHYFMPKSEKNHLFSIAPSKQLRLPKCFQIIFQTNNGFRCYSMEQTTQTNAPKKLCMRKWLIKGKQTEIIMMTKD